MDGFDELDFEALQAECTAMQNYLEERSSDDPNELAERIAMIGSYMARSGDLLARVKYIQDVQRQMLFNNNLDYIKSLPASVANKFLEAGSAEANYFVNWLDRINRSCVHQQDGLRTIFSYVKENLKMTRSGY